MKLFPTIAKAWKSFVANKKILPLIVLVDLLFLYGIVRLQYEVFSRAAVLLAKLSAMISQEAQATLTAETIPQLSILRSPEFISTYHEVLKHLAVFFGSALLIWLVAKGIVWYLAHKSAEKRVPIRQYAFRFAGTTIVWFILLILLLTIVLSLLNYAFFSVFPLIGPRLANIISGILLWLFAYVVMVSYSLLPMPALRKAFLLATRHWKTLLPVHVLNSLFVFVSATVPAELVKINFYAPIIFVVLIALPGIALTRVLWINAVKEVVRRE